MIYRFVNVWIFIASFSLNVWANDLIPHSVGVAISEQGQAEISQRFANLLFINGISPNEFFLEEVGFQTDEGPIEELFSDDPEVFEIVKKWRGFLERILIGVRLDSHQFSLQAKELEAAVVWDELSFQIEEGPLSPEGLPDGVILNVFAEANALEVAVGSVRGSDLKNPYLGEVGFDKVLIALDQQTGPLDVRLKIHLTGSRGNFEVKVLPIEWNWDQLRLKAEYDRPLIFPEIQITINGHTIDINLQELDAIFTEQLPGLLDRAGVMIAEYVEGEGIQTLNKLIDENLASGLNETNQMNPPGAPTTEVEPFNWGIQVSELNFDRGNFFVNLSGFARDGSRVGTVDLNRLKASKKSFRLNTNDMENHDMALALNQGFLNRVIELSSDRGYFNSFDLEDGEKIKLTKTPVFDLTGKSAAMALEIEYIVTGFEAIFVRNPIRIQFDLLVDFPIDNGKAKIVAKGVDLDSVHLDDRYIRFFSGKVRKALREKIEEMQAGLQGFSLADELPFPSTLFGVALKVGKVSIDNNGHLVVYHDFDWSLFD